MSDSRSVIERSIDTMPPASPKLERSILGALMVANWQQRDPITAELSANDFHDPWHRWVFLALRHWRRGKPEDLLMMFGQAHRESPARIGDMDLQHELCLLLIRIDGNADCGKVSMLRRMAGDLRALAMQRKKQTDLEAKLLSIVHESEQLIDAGEDLI